MELRDKILLAKLVVAAVAADRDIDSREADLVDRVIEFYELDEHRMEILQSIQDDTDELIGQLEHSSSRDEIVAAVVLAVAADEVIDDAERQFVDKVAAVVGMDDDQVDDVIVDALNG